VKILAHRICRRRSGARDPAIKTAGELVDFVETIHSAGVPFLCVRPFASIRPPLRPDEIPLLQPAHVKLDAPLIRLDGEVSKVRELRNVTIQLNLAAGL
jgi:hypothetical protein